MSNKKASKEARKTDDKSVEHVLKALSSLQSPEEKLAAMCKKYTEIVDENRKTTTTNKQWEKKYVLTQREKEQLQLEYNKTVLLKVKLESLCRELQKQNKAVKVGILLVFINIILCKLYIHLQCKLNQWKLIFMNED